MYQSIKIDAFKEPHNYKKFTEAILWLKHQPAYLAHNRPNECIISCLGVWFVFFLDI